jgi:hypothetical protein
MVFRLSLQKTSLLRLRQELQSGAPAGTFGAEKVALVGVKVSAQLTHRDLQYLRSAKKKKKIE